MTLHTRVLFLGDDVACVTLALGELSRSGISVEHRIVATAAELRDALRERWSAVISSPRIGDLDIRDTLRMIRAHDEEIPFIIFSSNGDAAAVAELIRAGANDYVKTSDAGRLGAAVARQMKEARMRAEARRLTAALEESDRQYRLTFENAPIGIAHADASGRIILANLRFCALIGYTLGEVIGRHFNVFSHADDAASTQNIFEELVAGTRTTARYERRYVHKDGTTVWAAVTLSCVAQRGALIYVLGLVEDITERKHSEEELRVRATQQSAIAELGTLAMRTLDWGVIERACALVKKGLGVEHSLCVAPDADGQTMRLRAGKLESSPIVGPLDGTTHAGATLLAGEPIVVENYAIDGLLPRNEAALANGFASGVMVPIASATRTFGVLSAHARIVRTYGPADVHFMQSIAHVLAEAMEREHAREALVESEERYRSVVEGSSEIIFTTDVAGRFLTLNAAFEKITGLKRAEWIGRDSTEVTSMVDGAHTTSFLHRVISEQIPLSAEMRIAGREGDVLVDIAAAPKIENDRATAVFGFARDITEARRDEKERQQLARNFELLLNSTVEGILEVDRNERCTLINRAAAVLLARPAADCLGHPMHDLLNDAGSPCTIEDVLRTGTPCTVTTEVFRRGDGTTFPVEYSASPIRDLDSVIGVVVTFTDVTDRRKLEAQLEQAGRLTSLGRLAATIAHEFNNVLMGISPFIEIIRRGPSPEKMSTALDHVGAAIRRGKHITDEILRFTQPAEPIMSPIAVDPWLRGIELEARTILMPSKHAIATAIEDPSLTVRGDSNQLHQVFTNLIGNARDAMPDGGPIVIRVRRERPGARFPYGVLDRPERFAHFVVEDSGCGMSAETRRHIFEPLFTTKKNGTGIGLAVSHQVVQRHGGAIFVETELGAGTSFHLFIPLLELKEKPRTRVLLVEDDEAIASGVAALLEIEGMSVEIAETGQEALALAGSWMPDIAIIDVGLPDFDGPTVYRRMGIDMPVIFSSGEALDERLGDLSRRPNVSTLNKPYEIGELYAAIRKLLP